MRITKFKVLSASAPELAPGRFIIPDPEKDCRGPNGETLLIPHVGGSFTPPEDKPFGVGG